MSSSGTDSSSKTHLRLIAPPPRSSAELAKGQIYERPRCRPGEFPLQVRVTPTPALLQCVNDEARSQGVTAELWARLAVDAEHIILGLQGLEAGSKNDIHRALDLESGPQSASSLEALVPATASYLRGLRAGGSGPVSGQVLELLVPEDTAGAWRLAAIAAGEQLEGWIEARLSAPRPRALLGWEISAASAHLSLREWCYAAWARRMANRTASPSRRTALSGLCS